MFEKTPAIKAVHVITSASLAGAAWWLALGEVLKDLAAVGSLCVSVMAMYPTVRAWILLQLRRFRG